MCAYIADKATTTTATTLKSVELYSPLMKVGKKRPRAPDSGADTSDARHHNAKRPRLLPERWDGVWFHECPLCDCIIKRGRHKTIDFADVHHLRPKSEHKRLIAAGICDFEECNGETALVILCRLCHSAIHDFWTNAQLADLLYTVKRLRYLLDKIGWQRCVGALLEAPVLTLCVASVSLRRSR